MLIYGVLLLSCDGLCLCVNGYDYEVYILWYKRWLAVFA